MESGGNDCQDLHDLLADMEYFADLDELHAHWEHCENCRASYPNASKIIEEIENSALSQIKRNIERLHEQYVSEDNSALHQTAPQNLESVRLMKPEVQVFDPLVSTSIADDPGPKQKLLGLLADKGEILRQQLQIMNDNWGLDVFRVSFEHGECEYDSRLCGSFIASLSREVQVFIFQAILAADIVNLFGEDQCPANLSLPIYRTVQYAAQEFLNRYLAEQKQRLLDGRTSELRDDAGQPRPSILLEKIERLSTDLEDNFDSLKAGQMEGLRLQKRNVFQHSEVEDDLINYIGKPLFGRLRSETQRHLVKAELSFRRHKEEQEFRPSIFDFHRAYECEFRYRISVPLGQKLISGSSKDYPLGECERKLVVDGKFNGRITLGEQLWFLLNDKLVRNIVSSMGFDVDAIHRSASRLVKARNDVAHDRSPLDKTAGEVRESMRVCLKMLFPNS